MDERYELPGLVTDSESDSDCDQSMRGFTSNSESEDGEVNVSDRPEESLFLSSGAMVSQSVTNTEEATEASVHQGSTPQSITDDEDDWSTIDSDSTDGSNVSDDYDDYDEYPFFDDSLSVSSDDSSVADEDEFDIFEMMSHHFEMFSNRAPSFFGVSLQMFYERIMNSLEPDEEKDTPTPQHILEKLPSVKVTISQVASSISCCICFGDYVLNEDLLQLPCTHFYHNACILNWLKIKSTCPTCRLDLTQQTKEKFSSDTDIPTSTNVTVNGINTPVNLNNIQGSFNVDVLNRVRSSSRSSRSNVEYDDRTETRNNLSQRTSSLPALLNNISSDGESPTLQSLAGSNSIAGISQSSNNHTPAGGRKSNANSKESKMLSRETEIW